MREWRERRENINPMVTQNMPQDEPLPRLLADHLDLMRALNDLLERVTRMESLVGRLQWALTSDETRQ